MAYTLTDLIAVRSAIVKGEIEVEFSDRRARYRSIAELLQAEAHILSEIGQTTSNPRPKQSFGVTVTKGF